MKPETLQSFRRDGWTPQRQLAFLDTLARTHCIAKAARAAGMSRESAYRLRAREPNGLIAAAWARALKGHKVERPRPRPKRRLAFGLGGIRSKVTNCTDPCFHSVIARNRDPRLS